MIAFVLVLAFLLLLVTFRSIVVPIKAIVLNLLSVAASYGVLVLVFQRHWAEGILGFHSNGAIISWLPLFLFVVLFGLSMDYHVFILSRVREGVDDGMTTEQAVRYGITQNRRRRHERRPGHGRRLLALRHLVVARPETGGRRTGRGRLLDATVIRGVLLPASMKLLGDWNWYLPTLARLASRKQARAAPELVPPADRPRPAPEEAELYATVLVERSWPSPASPPRELCPRLVAAYAVFPSWLAMADRAVPRGL